MREIIDTPDAVLALGNWLRSGGKPKRLTKDGPALVDGYDLHRPHAMYPEEVMYYNDVVHLAKKSPYVRIR